MTPIDFTRSLPPVPPALSGALADALQSLTEADAAELVRKSSSFQSGRDLAAAADWLEPRFGTRPEAQQIFLTNGTQSAILMLLRAFVPKGMKLVAECLSYGVLDLLRQVACIEIEGVEIDHEGIVPDALEAACLRGGVGAIYCNPTFHNPTAGMMSESRRAAIAEVARRFRVPIIEDDPIGLLYEGLPRPIAAIAPDVAWYVSGLTKLIAQGMRLAYVVAPTGSNPKLVVDPVSRLSHWVPTPIVTALTTQMLETGSALDVRLEIAQENLRRFALSREKLVEGSFGGFEGSPHIWLPLAPDKARQFVDEARSEGVLLRSQDLFQIGDSVEETGGVRLSLSSPRSLADVERGLSIVRELQHKVGCASSLRLSA